MSQPAVPVFTAAAPPARSIGVLPTTGPTGQTLQAAKLEADGKVGPLGIVSVEVDGACTLTLWIWCPGSQKWRNPGSASSSYQKTFSAAGYDFFVAHPGSLFSLSVASGTINAWTDGLLVEGITYAGA